MPSDPSIKSPSLSHVLWFTATYLLLAATITLATGNHEFSFYFVVVITLMAIVYRLQARFGLSNSLLWSFSIWGLLHMAGGLLPIADHWPHSNFRPVLYNLWLIPGILKYDQLVHAFGLSITTWTCWLLFTFLAKSLGARKLYPTPLALFLCFCASMGVGACHEIIEFLATRFFQETNVGDYANNGWDLVFNTVGSFAAILIIQWRPALLTTSSPQPTPPDEMQKDSYPSLFGNSG